MDSPSPTPDTTSTPSPLPDLPTLLSNLGDAVSAAWPNTPAKPYKKVKALLMSWEKDDLDVENDIKPLASIFQGLCHFDTEVWKIPIRRSAAELSSKIASIIEADGREENLIILYYGGHARPNDQAGGRPVWFANRSTYSPFLKSSAVHSQLSNVDCDILLLYDCPHAVQIGERFTGKGMIETIAASPLEPKGQPTDETLRTFTSSLIQELAHATHTQQQAGLSVVELHRKLTRRSQSLTNPPPITDESYSVVQLDRQTGQPIISPSSRQKTPTHHLLLATGIKPRTITLAPLQTTTITAEGGGETEPLILLSPPTPSSPRHIPESGPDILTAVRIRGETLDTASWNSWVDTLPAEAARGIRITAMYPSLGSSLLLLVKMPLVMWDLLPRSLEGAVSFVGYTTYMGVGMGDTESEEVVKVGGAAELGARWEGGVGVSGGKAPKWPAIFSTRRTDLHPAEQAPHCLLVSELTACEGDSTKAERIIREFTQDVGDPAKRYICDDIQAFCAPAGFEDLLGDGEDSDAELVAMVDDRPVVDGEDGVKFLNRQQLLETLLQTQDSTQAFIKPTETDSVAEPLAGRRRLVYITNLNPWSTLAIAATASQNQALALKDFVHKHITFQPAIEVGISSTGYQTFQLSFHLPYFAWRGNTPPSPDQRELRDYRDVTFLDPAAEADSTTAHLYEAQISFMVTGVDDRSWTAHAFLDTYHDGGESKRDVHFYEAAGDGAVDPLTGQAIDKNAEVADAREYFLRVMEASVGNVKDEWLSAGLTLIKRIKALIKDTSSDKSKLLQKHHHIVHVSSQLQQGLSGTIRAWERFRETDLPAYFVINPANTTMIDNINRHVRDCKDLNDSLAEHTAMFQNLSTSLLVLDTHKKTNLTTLLVASIACIAPFALAAITSATPLNSARYLFTSAILAAFIAAAIFAIWHWDGEAVRSVGDNLAVKLREFSQLEVGRFDNLQVKLPKLDIVTSRLRLGGVKVDVSGMGNGVRLYLDEAWRKWSCPAPREGYLEEISCWDGEGGEEEEECHVVVPM